MTPATPLAGLVVVGASLGGLVAIQEILRALPDRTSIPIVIAQHRHRDSGPGVLGTVLTGANGDGAAGTTRIRQKKGKVFAQDPTTAEAPAMPNAAIAAGVDRVLSLEEIARYLAAHCCTEPNR